MVAEQCRKETESAGFEYVSFEEEDRLIAADQVEGLLQPATD